MARIIMEEEKSGKAVANELMMDDEMAVYDIRDSPHLGLRCMVMAFCYTGRCLDMDPCLLDVQ